MGGLIAVSLLWRKSPNEGDIRFGRLFGSQGGIEFESLPMSGCGYPRRTPGLRRNSGLTVWAEVPDCTFGQFNGSHPLV